MTTGHQTIVMIGALFLTYVTIALGDEFDDVRWFSRAMIFVGIASFMTAIWLLCSLLHTIWVVTG